MKRRIFPFLFMLLPFSGFAADIVPVKQISLELAQTIAMKSVEACRKDGYKVSAVVLDRSGSLQVALRDTLAAPHTLEIAEHKAGMSIMSGIASSEFRKARGDIRPELNHMLGLIVMEGALPILAAEAVKAVEERLEFAN